MFFLKNNLQSRISNQKRALFYALITTLVLVVFQPFGTYADQLSYKYLRLGGYGVSTFLAVLLSGMLEIRLSDFREKIPGYRGWILGLYLLCLALFNHCYFAWSILGSWHWQNQLLFVYYAFAIAVLPASILYFQQRKVASEPTVTVVKGELGNNSPSSELVTIVGENKADKLSFVAEHILVLNAADNYCEILVDTAEQVKKHMIRSSLQKVLAQLVQVEHIARCHRSYGVNLNRVVASSGNANGMQLQVDGISQTIPVSRRYVKLIKQRLLLAPDDS